MYPLHLRL